MASAPMQKRDRANPVRYEVKKEVRKKKVRGRGYSPYTDRNWGRCTKSFNSVIEKMFSDNWPWTKKKAYCGSGKGEKKWRHACIVVTEETKTNKGEI